MDIAEDKLSQSHNWVLINSMLQDIVKEEEEKEEVVAIWIYTPLFTPNLRVASPPPPPTTDSL